MVKRNLAEMLRELINKIYNEPNMTTKLLDEIKQDLEQIEKDVDENKAYRELVILVEAARKQENIIGRGKFKLAILSGLEREFKKLAIQNVK